MRTIIWVVIGFGIITAALASFQTPPRVTGHVFIGVHPVLQDMAAAHDGVWSDDSVPLRRALLERLPVGTQREDITTALAREGFECQASQSGVRAVAGDPVRAKEDYVDCQLQAPHKAGSTRWVVDLWFDGDNRLLGARVAVWNIHFSSL